MKQHSGKQMKSIYESASSILEQNKMSQGNRSLPPLEGQGGGGTFTGLGSSTSTKAALYPSYGDRSAVFKSAAKIEKQNPVTPVNKSGKKDETQFYRVGETGPIRSGNASDLPKGATVVPKDQLPFKVGTPDKNPKQNVSNFDMTQGPAVFKTNPDRVAKQKAKELENRMDQLQQQGKLSQEKPKVSSTYYKNLKALNDMGIKPQSESRMSSTYSTIRRILGEVAYGTSPEDELKLLKKNKAKTDPKNLKRVLDREKQLEQEIAAKNKNAVQKPQASNTPSKDLEAKGLRGNEEMKKQEDSATKKEKTSRSMDNDVSRNDPLKPLVPGNSKSLGPVANVVVPSNKETDKSGPAAKTRSMQSNNPKPPPAVKPAPAAEPAPAKRLDGVDYSVGKAKLGEPDFKRDKLPNYRPEVPAAALDVEKMKQGIASSNKPVQYGLDQKDANDPLEAKRAAEKAAEIDTVKATKDNADAEKPVEFPASSSKDPSKMNQSNPNSAYTSAVGPATNGDSKVMPQAAMMAPSSEFKFSDEQEKWLGKANRQDPYILNRMPGDKPPVDYYKDPKDQELAKKINTGNDTVKKIKGAMGMKESTINKKFNITDALYQSVMEVMKKDKGSVPRNEKEKDLAAFHGDPNRITHGDVLKARGVTKEEFEQIDELSVNTLSSYGKKAGRSIDRKLDQAADHSKKATDLYSKGTASAVDKAYDHEDKANILHKQVNKRAAGMDRAAVKLGNKFKKGMAEGSLNELSKEEFEDFNEALVGNQHRIDANKNNKIDAHDFRLLRAKKKANESLDKDGKLEIEDRKVIEARKKLEMDKDNSLRDKEKEMTRGTRKPEPENGMGRIVGGVWQSDPKGKVKAPSGDPEGVKESKDTPGNSYEHQCAVHVKSESFGEGRTITTQHANPDADGNIAWYDVMFEHGIERYVPTNTLEILVSEMHMHSKKKKKMM